jgi:hypothetical protein
MFDRLHVLDGVMFREVTVIITKFTGNKVVEFQPGFPSPSMASNSALAGLRIFVNIRAHLRIH